MRSNSEPMEWRSTHNHAVPFGKLAMLQLVFPMMISE